MKAIVHFERAHNLLSHETNTINAAAVAAAISELQKWQKNIWCVDENYWDYRKKGYCSLKNYPTKYFLNYRDAKKYCDERNKNKRSEKTKAILHKGIW